MKRVIRWTELAPLSKNIYTHHLFYASGIVLNSDEANIFEWIKQSVEKPTDIALTADLFEAPNFPKILDSLKTFPNRKSIFFEISDLPRSLNQINLLATLGFQIDLLFHREISQSEIDLVTQLIKSYPDLRLLFLENKIHTCPNILGSLPPLIRVRVNFVYLPKRNSSDCLMAPLEVIDQLDLRDQECSTLGLDLNILCIRSSEMIFKNDTLMNFYLEPSVKNYLIYSKRQNKPLYLFLEVVQKSKLSFFLGFGFWVLKIIFNPFAYDIPSELRGWGARLYGETRGLFVDLYYMLKRVPSRLRAFFIDAYWLARRTQDSSWRLRVYFFRILGQSWKVRVALIDFYWKCKSALHKPLKVLAFPFLKCYWFARYQYRKRILNSSIDKESIDA